MVVDLIYTVIIVFLGLLTPLLFVDKSNVRHIKKLRALFLFHILLGIGFFFLTNNGGGDAWLYWEQSKNMNVHEFWQYLYEAKGTYFMYSFNYLLSNLLGMDFFVNSLVYVLIGYVGVVCFYIVAVKTIPNNTKYKGYFLFPIIFFMPNLHFWSSGIGKDTVLFFCLGIFSFALLNLSKRIPLLLLALVLSYLVRPHITLFLLISYGIAYLTSAKISPIKRTIFTIILLGAGIAIAPYVMQFVKIEDASIESFNKFSDQKSALLSRSSGSSIDVSSYSFPAKVFAFLYRPFFFDIRGIPAVIASFENLLLLMLTWKVIRKKPIQTFKAAPLVIKGLLFFLIIGTIAFSQSLGNIGIMLRMRNMFLPGMLIYFLWSFSYQRQLKLARIISRKNESLEYQRD